jgi:glutamate racemase
VLGCTHYPFVIEAIRRLVGPGLAVLDPAPAVARHLGEVLTAQGLLNGSSAGRELRFFTSAQPDRFDRSVGRLVGARCRSQPLVWHQGHLHHG